jgi:hypothetical protein
MGRQLSKIVLNVSGEGLQPSNWRRTYTMIGLSGFIAGSSLSSVSYILLQNHRPIANVIVSGAQVVAAAISTTIAFREGRRLKKLRNELREQSPQLLCQMRADFERRYPDDPEFVAAILHEMEENLKL